MKDYNEIISKVTEAVKQIGDEKLKEIAFQKLLDHALNPQPLSSSSPAAPITQRPLAGTQANEEMQTEGKKNKGRSRGSNTGEPYNKQAVRKEVQEGFKDVHAKIAGLKPYGDIKTKIVKFLWVLEVGISKGLEAMTNSEIAYVLDTLFREGVTEKQVNNLTFKTKDGWVQRRDVKGLTAWRILADGSNQVKIGEVADGSGN